MAVVLRFGGQRLRFGGNNLMWSGHIPHFHTKLIIERALQVGAQLPTKLAEFDLYVRDMYPIWMEYHDLQHRYRGDGDVLFKCINLANPDWVLATPYGGLTWTDDGVKGSATNGYINTGFNPSLLVSGQKYQLNDACRGAVAHDDEASGNATQNNIDGNQLNTNNVFYMLPSNDSSRINQGNGVLSAVVNTSGVGFKALCRTSPTDVLVINKDTIFPRKSTSTVIADLNQLVMRTGSSYSIKGLSSFFMGKAIPYSVSQDIRAIENADMARLGLPQIA
ncbi:hypothetical protein G5B30_16550 [Sphingobacterium sp. SGG-5]|uniref:hypothetical protein n=1 Tax=Sphingobacterium sp. SGG-5 TaxID=2710881 RepID=UPI0013ED1745|nr:hypothetical protein [Sphingobacterium sp. SGG-5]NGM63521.1 hypothetical protein [Sphingobacterium sp. SGG-5]